MSHISSTIADGKQINIRNYLQDNAGIHHINKWIFANASRTKFACWKEGLHGKANLFQIDRLSLLMDELVRVKPEILLLDYQLPGLDGARGVSVLRRLCPETKIVIFNNSISEEEEWAMLEAGVRGFCSDDIEPTSIKTLVAAIQKGELWIRRTLIHRLLEQLQEQSGRNGIAAQDSLCLLESLTQRENEIAVRVGNGECNKKIASSLNITERTVKAHLSEVFRKLNVTDRFKVAVLLSGENRPVRRRSSKIKGRTSELQACNIL